MATLINYVEHNWNDTYVGTLVTNNAAVGKLVYVNGITATVPQRAELLYDTTAPFSTNTAGKLLFYNMGKAVVGGDALVGDDVRVMRSGFIKGLVGVAVLGNPVYVGDAGEIDVAAGATSRVCGTVLWTDGVNYDIGFGT